MKKIILTFFLFTALPVLASAHGQTTDFGTVTGNAEMMPRMMGSFGLWNFWGLIGSLGMIVWLTVGILLIALLWKQITKKN